MIHILNTLDPAHLEAAIARFWERSAAKAERLRANWDPARGTPVFTVNGAYTARGWTEWTEGFVYGSEVLQFDATGEETFLEAGRIGTVDHMAGHVTHIGVHDHGFNNVSTYGNLLRLMNEGRIAENAWERRFYELALKGIRGGPGAALDDDPRRGLHLLLQRAPLAVRRHHPLAAGAGGGPPAGPRADGRERRADQPAGAAAPARGSDRALQRLLRRGARHLRRAGPHGAREHLQRERRPLPLPQLAAGLLAVQHLDPRPGLGHVRLRRAA